MKNNSAKEKQADKRPVTSTKTLNLFQVQYNGRQTKSPVRGTELCKTGQTLFKDVFQQAVKKQFYLMLSFQIISLLSNKKNA